MGRALRPESMQAEANSTNSFASSRHCGATGTFNDKPLRSRTATGCGSAETRKRRAIRNLLFRLYSSLLPILMEVSGNRLPPERHERPDAREY